MRAVLQRVKDSRVETGGNCIAEIGSGLLVFLGVGKGDNEDDADYLVDKIVNLRIFSDEEDRMNLSALDLKKDILVVSQFTLYGDCRQGRRPGFSEAAPPDRAEELYDYFVEEISKHDLEIETGQFQAMMDVELINDGPVTFLIDSNKNF